MIWKRPIFLIFAAGTRENVPVGCSKTPSSKVRDEPTPRRRYRPHFVGPFAHIINLGERKTDSSDSDLRESIGTLKISMS